MNLIPTAQAIAPTAEDFYDMEEMCIEYPESQRCYGPDPGLSGYDIVLFFGVIIFIAVAVNLEKK